MFEVKAGDLVLAIYGDLKECDHLGWQFFTQDNDPLQFGVGIHNEGTVLKEHKHKLRERIPVHKTHEFVLVLDGVLEGRFYDNDLNYVETIYLTSGDFVYLIDGGHGFKICRDNTRLLEVKNGHYVDEQTDKERFEPEIGVK